MKILQVALGLLAAVGGFVDIGDLVFNTSAGAEFGYALLWAIVVGTLVIMTYSEMCGRVAAVAKRPVFDAVRERLGYRVGVTTLVASELVNILTCTAEVGGIAIVLRLLLGLPYRPAIVIAVVLMLAIVWFLSFDWIERIFGFGGLLLVVFAVAAFKTGIDWQRLAAGLVPRLTSGSLLLAYFAVGLASSAMMPYEVYFYSSGGVEEGWKPPEDLSLNRLTTIVGYGVGSLLSFSLVIVAAQVLLPRGITPETLGTVPAGPELAFGKAGLLLALLGMLFTVGGASVDTAMGGAYSLAQFCGWNWGKFKGPRQAPRFTIAWAVLFVVAGLIVATGIDPLKVTEVAVIFSAVALPFTYFPVLFVARDRSYMGEYANGAFANVVGWLFMVVVVVIALAAIPLLVLTHMGSG